jgi:hypothetical protein
MGHVLGAIALVLGLLVAPSGTGTPSVLPIKKEALLVGDSVMSILLHTDAALTLLEKEHPFLLRSVPCQRLIFVGCKPFAKDSSLKLLQMNKGKFSTVVVVGTGYNDLDDANFARAVREITSEAKTQGVEVLWLTYRQAGNVRMKSVSYNRQLFELEKKIDNLHILRWCDISNGHPEWFTADSVHMNATGGLALAKAISAAIGQLTTT